MRLAQLTIAASFMKDPATVEVARRNTPAELVAQVQHPVAQERKRELLAHLVKSNDWRQVLVFVRTKHGANRLAHQALARRHRGGRDPRQQEPESPHKDPQALQGQRAARTRRHRHCCAWARHRSPASRRQL